MARSLRLLSANLANGSVSPCALRNLVQSWEVEIAIVQETTPPLAEALSEVLPHGDFEPATDYTGMGIASRHPAEFHRIPLVYRRLHIAKLRPELWPGLGAELELIGIHIAAPHIAPFWAQPRRRAAQLAELFRYTRSKGVAGRVVAGDFNATPMWPVYRAMVGEFVDLVADQAQRHQGTSARTWPQWRGPALFRIDHCFGQGLKAAHCEAVPVPGSDHYGLLVDLELP
ncbi:endonuclease/exonuclease/phosphatase family protein [Myxococcota bacterium]|nr:endonuclease/exonuclease/phosphatase family protein [Myxococcota bacterium]